MTIVARAATALVLFLPAALRAQETPSAAGSAKSNPSKTKIQVNFLNPCHPAAPDVEEMTRALERFKERPKFTSDFEISRGVTTLSESEARAAGVSAGGGPSSWVRIRHEFPEKAALSDAQYTLSIEGGGAAESLVLHSRESKDVMQVLISDSVAGSATQALQVDTPPERIRVERFGKSSIVLARCAGMDQAAYEPVFQMAGDILEKYRAAMSVKAIVPGELARLPGGKESKDSGVRESGIKESKSSGANH
jgi:hypothetical protein